MPPSTKFTLEIRELALLAIQVGQRYRSVYGDLDSPSGSGFGNRSNNQSSPTEAAWESQERIRADCRRAVKKIRDALEDVKGADAALGTSARQPTRLHDRAVVTQRQFDEALHLQRERELREEA